MKLDRALLLCSLALSLLLPLAPARADAEKEDYCQGLANDDAASCRQKFRCGTSHGDPSEEEQEENARIFAQCQERRESTCVASSERVYRRCIGRR